MRCDCRRVAAGQLRGLGAPVVKDRNQAPVHIEFAGIGFPAPFYSDSNPARWFLTSNHGAWSLTQPKQLARAMLGASPAPPAAASSEQSPGAGRFRQPGSIPAYPSARASYNADHLPPCNAVRRLRVCGGYSNRGAAPHVEPVGGLGAGHREGPVFRCPAGTLR